MSVIALGSAQIAKFMIIVMLMFAGIFVIAVITPKLAAFIDKMRGKAPDYGKAPKAPISPFESAPLPERAEDGIDSKEGLKPEDDAASGNDPAAGADTSPENEGN